MTNKFTGDTRIIRSGLYMRHWGEGVTAEEMGDYVWLRPVVGAEIKFMEWAGGDVLRHPEFVGFGKTSRQGK